MEFRKISDDTNTVLVVEVGGDKYDNDYSGDDDGVGIMKMCFHNSDELSVMMVEILMMMLAEMITIVMIQIKELMVTEVRRMVMMIIIMLMVFILVKKKVAFSDMDGSDVILHDK